MVKKICSVENCDREATVKGMCDKHYRQMKKHGRITDGERSLCFIDRTGEENYNTFGTKMVIIECKDATNMIVEFQDKYKYKKKCAYREFKSGKVKNPYDRDVYNVGYIGVGKYNTKEHRKIWTTWNDMLKRCYEPYAINKNLSYIDCFVCEEWHNFQNFAKWYNNNYYEVKNEKMHLDKDILYKDNKIYSPRTCIFAPERINTLFVGVINTERKYPIGVSYHKSSNKLRVQCNILDENNKRKNKYLGIFPLNKPFQAFYTYKIFKENYIKEIASEYKDLIPQKLYNAMMNYEVEIND